MRHTIGCEKDARMSDILSTRGCSVFPLGIPCFVNSFVPVLCTVDEILLLHAIDPLQTQAVQDCCLSPCSLAENLHRDSLITHTGLHVIQFAVAGPYHGKRPSRCTICKVCVWGESVRVTLLWRIELTLDNIFAMLHGLLLALLQQIALFPS